MKRRIPSQAATIRISREIEADRDPIQKQLDDGVPVCQIADARGLAVCTLTRMLDNLNFRRERRRKVVEAPSESLPLPLPESAPAPEPAPAPPEEPPPPPPSPLFASPKISVPVVANGTGPWWKERAALLAEIKGLKAEVVRLTPQRMAPDLLEAVIFLYKQMNLQCPKLLRHLPA